MTADVTLRAVTDSDLPIFFEQERDADARYMAAFTSKDGDDREAFMTHWARVRSEDSNVARTILYNGQVAGNIGSWLEPGDSADEQRHIGYWLGKVYWGKGIATRALTLFLRELPTRPLYAHAAKDNHGSIRVLEKCGFTLLSEDMYFSHSRGAEIPEVLMRLDTTAPDTTTPRE
jgi:RimJ/RimL family protein N-acetyltransferase